MGIGRLGITGDFFKRVVLTVLSRVMEKISRNLN